MLSEYLKKNPELVKKAKDCKSKDELEKLLRDNKINFSHEEIERIYNYLNNTELDEDALDSVAGGAGKSNNGEETFKELKDCTPEEAMQEINNGGRAYYLEEGNAYIDIAEYYEYENAKNKK